jgi:hypothetical protein
MKDAVSLTAQLNQPDLACLWGRERPAGWLWLAERGPKDCQSTSRHPSKAVTAAAADRVSSPTDLIS